MDILLCHDIDVWTHGDGQPAIYEAAHNGALRALTDLRSEGVIRAFGLGVNEWRVCSEVRDEFDVDCFLLAGRFTLLEQEPLDEFLPKCVEQDVSIIIGGPYNSGLLAVSDREQSTYDYKPVDDEHWERAQAIRLVCDAHGVDTRAAALQYPLQHAAVASVISGAKSVDEVMANLGFVAADIPDALWADLDAEGLARAI
jgi:D-threo-aldose 1-dehydrogenase